MLHRPHPSIPWWEFGDIPLIYWYPFHSWSDPFSSVQFELAQSIRPSSFWCTILVSMAVCVQNSGINFVRFRGRFLPSICLSLDKSPKRGLKPFFLSPATFEGTETQRMIDFRGGNQMKAMAWDRFGFWAKPMQFVVPLCELCDSARDYFFG